MSVADKGRKQVEVTPLDDKREMTDSTLLQYSSFMLKQPTSIISVLLTSHMTGRSLKIIEAMSYEKIILPFLEQ